MRYLTFNGGQSIHQQLAPPPDAANRREQQKLADRQSKLSPEEIDALLKQSEEGVRYMRKNWGSMWRLPRYPMRLR